MVFFRILRSHHFYKFLRFQNTSLLDTNPLRTSPIAHSSFSDFHKCGSIVNPFLFSSIFQRTFSAYAQVEERVEIESTDAKKDESENVVEMTEYVRKLEIKKKNGKKPLSAVFKEAVGLSEKVEEIESSEEEESKEGRLSGDSRLQEIQELKKKIWKLETEVRILRGDVKDTEMNKKSLKKGEVQSKRKRLYSLFAKDSKPRKSESPKEDKPQQKELSPEMLSIVSRFHEDGYLNNANFLPLKNLDLSCFANNYSREFLRFAAERFGRDNQEIAKWLSGSELKKVALFGCPSLERNTVFAAKRLRTFFSIQEDTVCRACKLKSSCKFVNQRVWKVNNLILADVMRVLTFYALDSVSPQLVVPDELKASISRLLKEVINLSR